MSKVLVSFNDDWADEMDISGFVVMDKSNWEQIENHLRSSDEEITIYFGTNEENEYDSGSDFLDTLDVIDLTDVEAEVINNLFGDGFGNTSFANVFENIVDWQDEDDEEE